MCVYVCPHRRQPSDFPGLVAATTCESLIVWCCTNLKIVQDQEILKIKKIGACTILCLFLQHTKLIMREVSPILFCCITYDVSGEQEGRSYPTATPKSHVTKMAADVDSELKSIEQGDAAKNCPEATLITCHRSLVRYSIK